MQLVTLRLVYTITIFFSALLLFSVQPMIAKMILPELGGSPAVWQTVMLFFQILLLLGYGYVHLTTQKLTVTKQIIIHRCVLIIAFLFLPFHLKSGILFDRNIYPVMWLFETLLYSVSIPFFILSTSAPILQKWFSLTKHPDSQNPYFLYSASNLGSLIALLSYPFFIEPLLTLDNQTNIWSALFVLFFGLIIYISLYVKPDNNIVQSEKSEPPTWKQKWLWCFLSFIPSSLMLGVTNHVTTDIAAIPLLWIIPFALYLISFILVFSPKMIGYSVCKRIFPYVVITTIITGVLLHSIYSFLLIVICFLCIAIRYHGELVERKPQTEHLTYFYLWLSIGGALGGVFNAIIAPMVFLSAYEYHIVLLLSLVIGFKFKSFKNYCLLVTPTLVVIIFYLMFNNDVFIERNFFGVSRVVYDDTLKVRKYFHGTTNHGVQSTLEEYRLKPQAYYSGVSEFMDLLSDDLRKKPIAITGLGIGTLACYAEKNQEVDIYEIDPVVIKIATDKKLFTYMSDCQGNNNIILGDARINLQKAHDKRYGIMLMDAYSSDALPVHLLTKQALEIYLSKLDDNGIIAFNISNRFLDLKPVLAALSNELNLAAYVRFHDITKKETKDHLFLTNEWVLLSRNQNIFQKVDNNNLWQPLDSSKQSLWTDDYSSIFSILK